MSDRFILLIVALGVFVLGATAIQRYIYRHEIATAQIVKEVARSNLDNVDPSQLFDKKDDWGRPLKFAREASEIKIIQTIVSAGKDAEFGTADDIIGSHTDLNKSRIAGKWVGQKTREFLKGLKDGEKEPSRFDKFTK